MVSVILFCLGIILLPGFVLNQSIYKQTCSRDNSVVIEPDATAFLGGILSISEPGDDGYGCQPPYKYMQAIEGIRWALELLNTINGTISTEYLTDYYVPGITLGMKLFDNCKYPHQAAASLGNIYPELKANDDECSETNKMMFGIVGPTQSEDVKLMSATSQAYDIPFISFQATDPDLTLTDAYPNFMRTIAPDNELIQVIVEVLTELNWKYLVVLYDSSSRGRATFEEFHSRYVAAGHCLTAAIMFDMDNLNDDYVDSIMSSALGSQATGVLYLGDDAFAKALIKSGDAKMPDSGRLQWLMMNLALDETFPSTKYQNGIISITVASRNIVEFEDHWFRLDPTDPPAENPWFQKWYEMKYDCSVTPTAGQRDCAVIYGKDLTDKEREELQRPNFVQDPFVEPAITAVYAYANALRRAQMAKCPAVKGPCAALLAMSRQEFYDSYLKTVDLTFTSDERSPSFASSIYEPYLAAKKLSFDKNGDLENPSFYIWNYNDIDTTSGGNTFKFRRVGKHINGNLNLIMQNVGMYNNMRTQRILPHPTSLCPSTGCSPCIGLPTDTKYYYEPGDVVITGIFSLHDQGPTPLTCGSNLKTPNQVMYMEAMIYAINSINRDPNLLRDIKLGGLGIDDCSSPHFGPAFIAGVHHGAIKVHNKGNNVLNPLTIEAYTGAHTSPLTFPIAELMNSLKRPLVGYRAGNSELDDKLKYPYYVRAVPGIRDEIHAIIMMLKEFHWMHVQVVASDMPYSKDAEKVFREMAAREGICIVAKHMIGTTMDDATATVRGLSVGSVAPTVALLDTHEHRHLLEALAASPNTRSRIALIATSRWGMNDFLVEGLEEAANGVLTLSPKRSTLDTFLNYLRNLPYASHDENPWFKEWYAQVYNCTQASCDPSLPINDADKFHVMYEVDSVINSVRAIAYALQSLRNDLCGVGAPGICSEFITAANKGNRVVDELYKVAFNIEDMAAPNTFRFSDSQVEIRFDILNYNSGYNRVGYADPWENVIVTQINDVKLFENMSPTSISTSCGAPCLECLYMFNFQDYLYVPGDLMIGALFNVHYSGDGPFTCGDFRINNGAVYSEILTFALDRINKATSSSPVALNNGLRIGVLGFDACSNPTRALAILNRVKTDVRSIGPLSVLPDDIRAWITYDSETTAESALFLQKLGIPLVSPGATAPSLADRNKYTTLFRTVQSDAIIAKGMATFASVMRWKYVVVVNAPDDSSRQAADQFRTFVQEFGICVVARYEFETDGNMNVILVSLAALETDVVAVFSEPDQYIEEFLDAKVDGKIGANLRFIANRRWISKQNYNTDLQNSVFFEPPSPTIDEFYTFLAGRDIVSSDNPWLDDIYEEIFDCNLPGSFNKATVCSTNLRTISSVNTRDIWTLQTIHAVSSITEGLHRTLKEKCGDNYASVCTDFKHDEDTHERFMFHMDRLSFLDITQATFEFIERASNRGFDLYRYQVQQSLPTKEGQLSLEGILSTNNLQELSRNYVNVKSECSKECLVCNEFDGNLLDYSGITGTIYIVGLFDVHKKGFSPFTCGEINDEHGMQLLEAFNFAIDYVNSGQGIFKDKLSSFVLGGIGLDICQSPTRAANLVSNIQSGNFELMRTSGIPVTVRRIDAYIGTMDTESSIRVADILTELQIPQISYGATGMDLLNQDKYSYFLRSVPADDKQARAMISYLKKFEYNNIQVIHSFDEIGEPGAKEFERLSEVNLVCITKTHSFGSTNDLYVEADNLINNILSTPNAQVVVLWMKDPLPILQAAARNPVARTTNLFIATDKWGAHPEFLKDDSIKMLLDEENLVILDVETADIPEFDHYLDTKTPANNARNPWFKEYFESKFNCVWDTPVKAGETACDRVASIPRADDYVQDPYVLYVINAVFSAAKAIDETVKEYCRLDNNDLNVCIISRYQSSGEKRQKLLAQMRKVDFVDYTHQPFFYTEDGQSDRGFHIYAVNSDSNEFRYQNIGSYNDSNFLKLNILYNSGYNAKCDPDGKDVNLEHCTCPFKPDLPSRFMKKDDFGRGLTLAYVGDIHKADPNNKFACGPINTGVDLHRLLGFFYAIGRINSNTDFNLPDSIRLDGVALDSCSNGLRLGQDLYNLLSGNPLCDSDEPGTIVSPSSIIGFVVDKTDNAIPVSSMLSREGMITISPTASHGNLDDQYQHPYFIRTAGSNAEQAKVIVELMKDNDWDLMSAIYTDNMQYRSSLDGLLQVAENSQTCVSQTASLSTSATLDDARKVLISVTQQNGVKAIALFVDPAHVRLLMEASRELRLTGQYIWIFPANWETQRADISDFETELRGSILIQHRSGILEDFINYMTQMSFSNRLGIPDDWFEEIYETMHKCNIFNRKGRPLVYYSRICTENEIVTRAMVTPDESVLHVILSVYSVALGLNNIPVCSGDIDIAACLQLQDKKSQLIYNAIVGINFQVFPQELGNDTFDLSYDNEGNGQGGYYIKYYTTTDNGRFEAADLGTYDSLGLSNIDWQKYKEQAFGIDSSSSYTFSSICPLSTVCTCQAKGQGHWSYSKSTSNGGSGCLREGETSHDPDTGELTLWKKPGLADRFEDTWAIIVTILACCGAFVALVLFVYLIVMYPVRGGTSILGYILSFGIILLYLMVLPFIYHADGQICSLRRFGLGFVYSIVYSALLVKLLDCWRVRGKNDEYNIKYSKLGRPIGLFLITFFLVLVQVMINTEWLILEKPDVECIKYKSMLWPRCTPDDFYDEGLVLSLCYNMALIVFSFLVGLFTYTSLQNHREPRWILAIFALTIPCWVIWCLVASQGKVKMRDAAVAVGLLINATIILIFVPIRKIYLLHRYNVLIEEEEKQAIDGDYNSTYGRQYDNTPRMHDTGSVRGSSIGPKSYPGSRQY